MSAASKLRKFLTEIYLNNAMNHGDIHKLINYTRQIIENKKYQERYQNLNFYCNWFLHTELTMSNKIFYILNTINNSVILSKNENLDIAIKNMSSSFSLIELRNEFLNLYKEKVINLPVFLFDNESNWKTIISLIVDEILDKPIEIPEKWLTHPPKKLKSVQKQYLNMFDECNNYGYSSAKNPPQFKLFARKVIMKQNDDNYNGSVYLEISLDSDSKIKIQCPLLVI